MMEHPEQSAVTLMLTTEQEDAIQAFFGHSGWDYIKVGESTDWLFSYRDNDYCHVPGIFGH